MFKSLKDKLKGWMSKAKEETEEEIVETPVEEAKKETTKKPEKKKKQKKETTPKKEEKKEEKKKEEGREPKKEEIKKPTEETKEEKTATKEAVQEEEKEVTEEKIEKEVEQEIVTEAVEAAEESKPESTENKKGLFGSLFKRKKETEEGSVPEEEVQKTIEEGEVTHQESSFERKGFSLFKRKTLSEEKFDELFDELELILLQNNVAYEAIEGIKSALKEKLVGEGTNTDIETALKEAIESLLINPPNMIELIKEKEDKPFVILFAGINGAGKTTTIAKVAHLLKRNNLSVCLASGDTFRAAAIEQLQVHADRLEIPLIKKDYGADPASVGFDAVKYAQKNNINVVLIDTAGRMNNRDSLMREIEKIARVNKPDLKIFLGESITGNDATEQAKDFNDAITLDGIILSKADVDEKGGTAISVSQVTGKPIFFLGMGQEYDDLEVFDKQKLIEKIFS